MQSSFGRTSFGAIADFDLRPARSEDFPALVELALASADTGKIRVSPHYVRNPVDAWAALKPELEWVVAVAGDRLIGGGQVIFSRTEVEGTSFPCAVLSGLMVHRDFRRQGVARALTEWRLERAGDDAVVVAAIQTGNDGSVANARKWATQIFGKLVLPVFGARGGFTPPPSLEVREPEGTEEWEAASAGLDGFERGWNLRTIESAEDLRSRASRTFDGRRLQRYYVVVEGKRVVGGFELVESAELQTLVFEHLPLALRALNVALHVVPPDGELRANGLSRVWYAKEGVAPTLWRAARSLAAVSGNAVGTQFDSRGPLGRLLPLRPWTPKGTVSVAVRSPVAISEQSLLSPP